MKSSETSRDLNGYLEPLTHLCTIIIIIIIIDFCSNLRVCVHDFPILFPFLMYVSPGILSLCSTHCCRKILGGLNLSFFFSHFPFQAQQYCQLRHVISLWRLLTLERARILIRRGEVRNVNISNCNLQCLRLNVLLLPLQDPFEQISDTFKQVMSRAQLMKFSSGMRRIDLDFFVSEVLELILLNLRGDAVPGEEEMR